MSSANFDYTTNAIPAPEKLDVEGGFACVMQMTDLSVKRFFFFKAIRIGTDMVFMVPGGEFVVPDEKCLSFHITIGKKGLIPLKGYNRREARRRQRSARSKQRPIIDAAPH